MGNASAKAVDVKISEPAAQPIGEKPKLKPCCACPETKRARDACIIENGEENCGPLIEEHKACMRKMGDKLSTLQENLNMFHSETGASFEDVDYAFAHYKVKIA